MIAVRCVRRVRAHGVRLRELILRIEGLRRDVRRLRWWWPWSRRRRTLPARPPGIRGGAATSIPMSAMPSENNRVDKAPRRQRCSGQAQDRRSDAGGEFENDDDGCKESTTTTKS